MTLHEVSATLRAGALGKVVFVLDASESAAQHQAAITRLVQGVDLPAGVEKTIYFLGNPRPHPLNAFAAQAAGWFEENGQRASLITPVFDHLDPHENQRIAIIGAGQIFDLQDWEGTPLLERSILVCMGKSLGGKNASAQELNTPTAQELRGRLHDPLVRIEIHGLGFMPTLWDNREYKLRFDANQAVLFGEGLENYTVALRFFVAQDGEVDARLTYTTGQQQVTPLTSVDSVDFSVSQRSQLTATEANAFSNAIAKRQFTCPTCRREHPWNTLKCRSPDHILDMLVYPSLTQRRAKGLVRFQTTPDGVWFEVHPCSVLRLGSDTVARSGEIYRFDADQECWVETGDHLEPYHPIGEGAYAIMV